MKKKLIGAVNHMILPNLPRSLKDNTALRYLYSRLLFKRYPNEGRSILLYTLPKSGTHYMRFFLANYLFIHFEGVDRGIEYDELEKHFSNATDGIRDHQIKYQAPHPIFTKTKYTDLVFGHDDTGIEFSPAKIIALYRNPLDFLVSTYYYRYINRKSVVNKPESADLIVDEWLPHLIKTYRLMDRLGNNAFRVSYEEIMRYPEASFGAVIRWLGLPFDIDHLKKSIEFSQIDSIRKQEDKNNSIVSKMPNFTGRYFTRSGKIGEWKDELKPETVERICMELEANGVNFSRFTLE